MTPRGITVDLSANEVTLAALGAVMQRLDHVYRNSGKLTDRFESTEHFWQSEIVGAIGEVAVAKALRRPWLGPAGYVKDGADVGNVQVRATTYGNGRLVVYRGDPDAAPFVLVVGSPPRLRVVGWLTGAEAKQPAWWNVRAKCPAYFVPQDALRPIERLPEL